MRLMHGRTRRRPGLPILESRPPRRRGRPIGLIEPSTDGLHPARRFRWRLRGDTDPAGGDPVRLRSADRRFGPIGVAGVYGVGSVAGRTGRRIGWVEDCGRMLGEGPGLPAPVATLDELLLIARRGSPLRFDPELGFRLYGADPCLQAVERGPAAVARGEPCRHRSRTVGLPGRPSIARGCSPASERTGYPWLLLEIALKAGQVRDLGDV
jgi:hypothetical protein